MTSNTVTISASCLSTLPPGDYHYSLFEGIDIFKPAPEKTVEELLAELSDAESKIEQLEREISEADDTIEDLERKLSDAKDEIDDLERSVRGYQQEIEELESQIPSEN